MQNTLKNPQLEPLSASHTVEDKFLTERYISYNLLVTQLDKFPWPDIYVQAETIDY